MSRTEHLHLLGERKSLQQMLDKVPPTRVIERKSLEGRLRVVEQRLADAQAGLGPREPARATLTFRGRPVVGQHGIVASFGMKAVNSFADAVATIAASLSGPVADMGPIPRRDQNQLLITKVALGSFGFELEEHQVPPSDLGTPTFVESALERAADLLLGTIDGDDEHLADAAADLSDRALNSIQGFVKTLADHDALCALTVGTKSFRFSDSGQVQRSLARLAQDHLLQEEQELEVVFLGALPHSRTFEFQMLPNQTPLSGRCAPGLPPLDPINDHRHQAVRARFQVTRVGAGKPRYQLLELPVWAVDS